MLMLKESPYVVFLSAINARLALHADRKFKHNSNCDHQYFSQCNLTHETACAKRLQYHPLQIHFLLAPLIDTLLLNRLGAVIPLCNGVKSPSSFKLYAGSSSRSSIACQAAAAPAVEASVKEFSDQGVNKRLDFLVEQACDALDTSVANFKHVLFPCALIAGDVVILHLLHKQGLLQSGRGVRP